MSNTTSLGLIILDACRNNPFAAKMQRSLALRAAVSGGLGRIEPIGNVLVAYAARDGTTALDGDGRNSPFTAALLHNIETPGVEVTFMFRNVRDDVMEVTRNEQQPFVYGSPSREDPSHGRVRQSAHIPCLAPGRFLCGSPRSSCDQVRADPAAT